MEVSEKYDIEKYRKKKQRKKLFRKGIIVLLILLAVAIIFFIVEAVFQSKASVKEETHFPVNLAGVNPITLNVTDQGLVVTGEAENIFYNDSAKKESSKKHGFANPIVVTSGNKVLTYDQGGKTIRMDTKNGELHPPVETEAQILLCRMNSSGYVGAVTFEDRFNGSLTIYDNNFEVIYKYKESQYYITGFDFISDDKGVLVAQTVNQGHFSTIVYGLDFQKKNGTEFFQTELDGFLAYSVEVKENGNIQVIGDKGVTTLNKKGEVLNNHTYQNQVRYLWNKDNMLVLALENIIDSNETDIVVLSDEGTLEKQAKVNAVILDMYCGDDRIFLLDKNNIYEYSNSLELLNTYPNSSKYIKLASYEQTLYGMSSEKLDVIGKNSGQ